MKIIVTGGLGYIGSHTVLNLIDNGYDPLVIDNLNNSSLAVLKKLKSLSGKNLEFYELDIRDKSNLSDLLKSIEGIEGIIHFAAHKAVGESMNQPVKYYNNNISGLISLSEALLENEIQNIVFSSSCTVYGEARTSPVDENTPLQEASSPYGHTKLLGESILQSLAKRGILNVVALRYFNPIGAHHSAQIGELPHGIPQNLVPYVTQTAIGKRDQLRVFGNDYPTADGTAIRDYIHVMDLAAAHVKALGYLKNQIDVDFDTFNIGTGKGTSVLELIKTFEEVNQLELPYTFAPRRPGDVTAIYANPKKAKDKLNWQAKLDLKEALRSAWAWEQRLANETVS